MREYKKVFQSVYETSCQTCAGTGQCDDASPHDLLSDWWTCTNCHGTGFNPVIRPAKTMKQMALEFSHAFGRPVNDSVVQLTVTERELLGKLIFEEVVEYVTLGLGLCITLKPGEPANHGEDISNELMLELNEGQRYDPIESADGLGDINVLVHFNSLWHGFDIDAVTHEIFLSNMSKLGEDGKPIINAVIHCPVCLASLPSQSNDYCETCDDTQEVLIDPAKPIGKILKGPNYFKPDIARVIFPDVVPEGD